MTPADLAAVHELHARIERHDRIPIATPLAEFEEWLTDPHLLGAAPAPAAVPGIAIVPWDRAREEEARVVMNEAFADHWASIQRGPEAWQHELDSYGSRRDLSFFALEGGRIVGASRNSHYPADQAVNGRLDGWIGQLGVLRSHRKRGIASALIGASLTAFRRAGFTHSTLGVDSENPTGALALYERLGYRPMNRLVTCQMEA